MRVDGSVMLEGFDCLQQRRLDFVSFHRGDLYLLQPLPPQMQCAACRFVRAVTSALERR